MVGFYATHIVPAPLWYLGWKAGNPFWAAVGGVTCVLIGLTLWGIWRLRRWALWLSVVEACGLFVMGYLMLGIARFYWRSYSSLAERIKFLHLPEIILYMAFPVGWAVYVLRAGIRVQFRRRPSP